MYVQLDQKASRTASQEHSVRAPFSSLNTPRLPITTSKRSLAQHHSAARRNEIAWGEKRGQRSARQASEKRQGKGKASLLCGSVGCRDEVSVVRVAHWSEAGEKRGGGVAQE